MTHQSSDYCYIAAAEKISKGSLDYVMNTYKYQHTSPCAPSINIIGGNQQATMVVGGNLIDLETRIQRGEKGNLASCPSLEGSTNGFWSPSECDNFRPKSQQQSIDVRTTPLLSCPTTQTTFQCK